MSVDRPVSADASVEIRVERLRRSFPSSPGGEPRVVLKDISTDFHRGEIIAIVGASGSGKTVFLDHLVGLLQPDSGRILVADHDAAAGSDAPPPLIELSALGDEDLDRVRLHWAVVFQRNALFSGSVRDNVELWLREHTAMSDADIERRTRLSLAAARLDVDDVIDKDRESLSGGMAKRVAIARAIAVDPLVIFYDEPTTGLDPIVAGQIHELIFDVHQAPVGAFFREARTASTAPPRPTAPATSPDAGQRRTSIIVTHDRDLLRRIQPRVIMLFEGAICYDGPYQDFGKPDCPPAAEYLAVMPVLHLRPPRNR